MKLPDFTDPSVQLRALSWKQPYLALMLRPHNKIETRSWDTKYRGWVLMCASKKAYGIDSIVTISGWAQFERILSKFGYMTEFMIDGHALAVGYLDDVHPMHPSESDKSFVEYHPDLFCHCYRDVTPITPFPWKGKQGWSQVPSEVRKLIKPI